jgi:hypothetical protein
MEHISKVIPGAVAEIFIRRDNRHAFWREYYPQHADEWIAEEEKGATTEIKYKEKIDDSRKN